MPQWSSRSLFVRILSGSLVLLLVFAGSASAKKADKKKKSHKQYTVTEPVYKKITKAQEAMGEEQWELAIEALASLKKKADKGRMGDHERALTYQLLSAIAAAQTKYALSIEYKEKCLAQDGLPDINKSRVQFEIAQLQLAIEQYPEAVSALKRWFRGTDQRNSHAYYLLAVAYYQQGLLDKALKPAKKAVAAAKKPNQAWLQMLVALYLNDESYAEALPHVETMVTHFPKKVYYTQLSALYNALGEEAKSLAAMQLAYQQGFLTLDRELRRLSEMYLYHGLPYRAALLMDKSIADEGIEADAKSLELLANSWLMAREIDRAVDPLTRAAALAEDGDIYIRLGQVYLEREEWAAAADALAKGLEQGVEKEGDAQLLLGITYYNQNKRKSARSAFRSARKFDESKDPALQWLQMLDREAKRAAQEAANAS